MRRGRVIHAAVLALGLAGSVSPTSPASAQSPVVRQTTLVVDWPTLPHPWNEYAYLTVHVSPAQAGRVVRLDITGQGEPGFSELTRKRTDASGTVRMLLFTLCPDMPCTSMTQKYRVVSPATGDLTAARARGSVRVVAPAGGY